MVASRQNRQMMACFSPNCGVSRSSKYGRDLPWLFKDQKDLPQGSRLLSGQVMASAGVAGGRRRQIRTKTVVISTKATKTRHTHKPRKKTAHSERRWLARHSTAEHSREDID